MKKTLILIATLVSSALLVASEHPKFLRLEVQESRHSQTPTQVKINLPLSMLEAMGPTIQNALNDVELNHQDIDFRAIWREVRNAGPHDYVEVDTEDGHVTVSTDETHLLIAIDEPEQGRVTVRVPLTLGDWVFGQEERLDFELLLDSLATFEGDLLTVEGDGIHVRAWLE